MRIDFNAVVRRLSFNVPRRVEKLREVDVRGAIGVELDVFDFADAFDVARGRVFRVAERGGVVERDGGRVDVDRNLGPNLATRLGALRRLPIEFVEREGRRIVRDGFDVELAGLVVKRFIR